MVYFTSDTHFFHSRVIKFCKRPFSSVEEMNEALIKNWNDTVSPKDIIYHLGDFAFCKADKAIEIVKQLNGHKHLIFGNHDKTLRKNQEFLSFWESTQDLKEAKIPDETAPTGTRKVVMCHYAMRIWNQSHYGSIHCFGHSHNSMPEDPHSLSLDVGVDCWDYKPVSFEQIKEKINTKTFKPIDYHVNDH